MRTQSQVRNNVCGGSIFLTILIPVFLLLVLFAGVVGKTAAAAEVVAVAGAPDASDSKLENQKHQNQNHNSGGQEKTEHKSPSLNPLELASDTAVWSLVIFLLVFGILGKFAFKPIAKALDERESNIADKIASAQRTNDEAKEILQQYQNKLDKSKEEVRLILETARKDAELAAGDIVAKARESAVQERERAMKEIEGATTFALQKIAEQSATLATNLAGKIIHAEIKPEHHRDLIRGTLDEFVNVKN
ncbi:MAG: F0F1 ATP synthase subunit B [Planctomycetaceae bacterium]|jgi:F-type H+-transporting ATPase subunit b|nr:F0F1 ATP synthase subunit B [Planctomycetaceae bacterium]